MNKTNHHAAAAKPAKAEPQPWRTREDAEGWHLAARGKGLPGPAPLVTVELDLDAEQSAWLDAEAERTGLDYVTFLKQVIDERRQANSLLSTPR